MNETLIFHKIKSCKLYIIIIRCFTVPTESAGPSDTALVSVSCRDFTFSTTVFFVCVTFCQGLVFIHCR